MDTYQPEIWPVERDTIYAAIPALESGLEHTRSLLIGHDESLGRTTQKNKWWAETLEDEIRKMEIALEKLKSCKPS